MITPVAAQIKRILNDCYSRKTNQVFPRFADELWRLKQQGLIDNFVLLSLGSAGVRGVAYLKNKVMTRVTLSDDDREFISVTTLTVAS